MAITAYLDGLIKVQFSWPGDELRDEALNTFYCFNPAATGASTSELADFAEACTAAIATNLKPLLEGGIEWNCTAYDWSSAEGGQGAGSLQTGTGSGDQVPAQVAMLVNFKELKRYRGGHPRLYFPCFSLEGLDSPTTWSAATVTEMNEAIAALLAGITGSDVWGGGSYMVGWHARTTLGRPDYTPVPPFILPIVAGEAQIVPATIRRRLRRAGHKR